MGKNRYNYLIYKYYNTAKISLNIQISSLICWNAVGVLHGFIKLISICRLLLIFDYWNRSNNISHMHSTSILQFKYVNWKF